MKNTNSGGFHHGGFQLQSNSARARTHTHTHTRCSRGVLSRVFICLSTNKSTLRALMR